MKSHPDPVPTPWPKQLLLAAGLIIAMVALYRLQMVLAWQLATPFDLAFESPNLASIEALRQGLNIYDPSVFNHHPFIFTLYTPLYHLICAHLPGSADNPFLTGRLVAVAFMGGAALLVFCAAQPGQRLAVLAWLGLFFLLRPVTSNLAFLKNDGTALFFSVLALVLISPPPRTPARLALAALCCILAISAKQVYLSATAACGLFLLFERRKDALAFGLFFLLFAVLGGLAAHLKWGHGFWWCIFNAPRVPFDAQQFSSQWRAMAGQPVFLFLLILSLGCVVVFLRKHPLRRWAGNPFLLYFLFALAVLLATVGKPGSSTNYFIEPGLAAVFWLVSVFQSPWINPRVKPVAVTLGLTAALAEMIIAQPQSFTFAEPGVIARRAETRRQIFAETEALFPGTNRLRVLNFAGPTTFFYWRGEAALNDSYLYTLLWSQGALSPDNLIQSLRSQTYDLVAFGNHVTVDPGNSQEPAARIIGAVRDSYQLGARGANIQYWVRARKNETR